MDALRRWLNKIFSHEKNHSLVDQLFAPVDPEKIAEHLDVDKSARQSAEHEMPATDAQSPDAIEVSIAHVFEHDAQETAKRANDKLHLYRRQLERLDVQNEAQSIAGVKKRFDVESSALLEECRDQLRPYIEARTGARAELDTFKEENKIMRPPDYPDSKFLHFSILFVIFAFESVINAVFFAAGSDFGLIGGWVVAMQYAAFNLAWAVVISLLLIRQINHINRLRKVVGTLGIIVFALTVPAFNFYVGHFREIYAVNPEQAEILAIQSFLQSPLILTTGASYMLLGVGVIFAIVAGIDGYRFEDAYPGYGRVAKKLDKASDEYFEEKQQIKDYLSDLRDETIAHLDDSRESILHKQGELSDLSSLADNSRSKCQMHLALLVRSCNVVLAQYRQRNEEVRSTPAPDYFRSEYSFPESLEFNLPDTISVKEVQKRKIDITGILKSIEDQRISVHNMYAETLHQLDSTIQGLEFGAR